MTLKKNTLIIFLIVLIAAIGVLFAMNGTPPMETRYRQEALKTGSVTQTVSANGTLNPVTLVSVGTQVSGTVQKLYVDFNDRVKANQVLLELDGALLTATERQSAANMQSAKATLDLAAINYQRMKSLYSKEYVSRQEVDQARQTYQSAQASLAQTTAQNERDRANLNFTVIRSPVDGVVIDRSVDIGQTVAASFQTPTLIKIAKDLAQMSIDTSFAEADIGNIREGQDATFTVDAFPSRTFVGKVKQIRLNPTTTSNVVTYNVRIDVDNHDEVLLPGMTAYVNIGVIQRQNVLLVPNAALRFRPPADSSNKPKTNLLAAGGPPMGPPPMRKGKETTAPKRGGEEGAAGQRATVYVIRDNKMEPVSLRIGITDNRFTEVLKGELKDGDQVVVGENLELAGKKSSLSMSLF